MYCSEVETEVNKLILRCGKEFGPAQNNKYEKTHKDSSYH